MAKHLVELPAPLEESLAPNPRDGEMQEHPKPMEELETVTLSEEWPTRVVTS